MAIVDFEQDPEMPLGTGNFRDDKGRQMYLSDPETASRFIKTMPGASFQKTVADESTAAATGAMGGAAPAPGPDLRTASNNLNDTGLPTPVGDVSAPVPGVPAPAPPVAPAAPPAAPGSAGTALVQKLDQLPKKPPPAAAPPAAAAPVGGGLPVASTQHSRQVVKGADKANVLKRIGEEEEAGKALDEQRAELGAKKDARVAASLGLQRDAVKAEGAKDFQVVADARAKQEEAARMEALKRKELEANDKMLDPDRYMRNMSTGKKIGMVILAALNGGFGTLAGQKENGVMAILNAEIERDIDRQKSEIASGRIRKQNEIDKYVKMGFDAETAEKMARDRMSTAVMLATKLEAERLGVEGENAENASFLNQQAELGRAQRRGDLMATTENRETIGDTTTRAAPAGKGDGMENLMKQLQIRKLLKEEGWALDKNGNVVGTGEPTPAELERADKQLEAYDTTTSGLVQAQVAFQEVLKAAQVARDEQGGLVPPSDIPGKGMLGAPATAAAGAIGMTTDGTKLKKAIKLLEEAFGRMQSQGAITDEELMNFRGYIDDSSLEGGFMENLGLVDTMINGVGERHMRRLGPVALQELARRELRQLPTRGGAGVRPVTGVIAIPEEPGVPTGPAM